MPTKQIQIEGGGAGLVQTVVKEVRPSIITGATAFIPSSGVALNVSQIRLSILGETGVLEDVLFTILCDSVSSWFYPSWDGRILMDSTWSYRADLVTGSSAIHYFSLITELI